MGKSEAGKAFSIDYSEIEYENEIESIVAITNKSVNEFLELYNSNKVNFALNIESLMQQIFYASDNEYWLLRAIRTVDRLKDKIIAATQYFGNFKKYNSVTIEEAISNLEDFYNFADDFGYSENENLLIAYIQYCKNSRPVLYVPKHLLMGDTEESFYNKGIINITQGLKNLQKEIAHDKWIYNTTIEDIPYMDKKDFKRFLVLKFRAMGYEVKGLSKGTAFVAEKVDKSILIESKVAKGKTSLSSVNTALLTKDYLHLDELWVYSISDYSNELIEYAAEATNIKLLGIEEIENLTKIY